MTGAGEFRLFAHWLAGVLQFQSRSVSNRAQANHDEVMTMTTLELEMEVAEIKTRLRRVERRLREEGGSGQQAFLPQDLPLNDDNLLDWLLILP